MYKASVQINNNWQPVVRINHQNNKEYQWFQAKYTNKTDTTVKFGGFRFDLKLFSGIPGANIRLYKEGWTMTSAAAAVRFGDTDFSADPDYLQFAVSAPEEYNSSTPNDFSAENVIVLNDKETDYSLLAGFISSADQITRFDIELEESGVKTLSAYSCGDGIEVDPGETVISEELVIFDGDDGYGLLEKFADLWGKRMKALTWSHVPTGWCSWYYYFDKITETDVLENIKFISEHKEEFPIEYIQLDDGYEAALGDWLICNEKFPHGLQFLAQKIKAIGLRPGIWLAPFMVEERSQLFKSHPDWMVKDATGEIMWASEWRGSRVACLDGTHPGAQEYLYNTFATLVKWGFEYVKLDFMTWACMGTGGHYYDRKATRAQALRRGLQVIRDAMGDRFILGCTTPLGPVIGLVNGERIGTDITPYWKSNKPVIYAEAPAVPNVCRNIINRSYMNGRLWISDPDTHIARSDNNKLSENEIVLWTYALFIVGGMMLLSDRFETLAPERAELSKLLLAEPGIFETRPLDFFEREYPAVWLRRSKDTGEMLLGLFNFSDETTEIQADLNKITPDHAFRVDDYMSGENIGTFKNLFQASVSSHSCLVFNLS